MYGQFCMIHKETDTVLAMTAVTGDMQGEMNVYYEEVLLHYPNHMRMYRKVTKTWMATRK